MCCAFLALSTLIPICPQFHNGILISPSTIQVLPAKDKSSLRPPCYVNNHLVSFSCGELIYGFTTALLFGVFIGSDSSIYEYSDSKE
jgi:hypothetical protein